ncbi:hypothetical protein POSPLADRAFT_1049286 [Postia placenta MAD-698-R-SB12]|uniref:Major facilitator superfamily (MFS) profile domain-containing protein n=1 Tax=Postia placenta MAD-698-R-SB12 TaxID=670580 RepID=A0A1X6MQH6_9APHY|nr:hypothetical protein POSPLADRAFT_1049286 [Postia placenta MAD-698-R-SB12]OSX58452.1 hypothetical protein POSPLADRAFT_1049286 [Postia placenta MAD-698-R-SB12]
MMLHGKRIAWYGIGTEYLNAIVPVWSAEVASHTSRGTFIASGLTLNIFGVVVAYWIEFSLGFIDEGKGQLRWRLSTAIEVIPVLMLMITYTLCTLFGIFCIDRVGRRIGLWWGAVGHGISLILAGALSSKDHLDKRSSTTANRTLEEMWDEETCCKAWQERRSEVATCEE